MKQRCMLCGRVIEEKEVNVDPYETDPYEDEEEMPKKKSMQICLFCQAKLKHEADDAQKVPRPM